MADQREVALHYIKTNGPIIPVQVSKVLNTNILFASAVLSELVEKKQLKMTHAAIGGSKVYYIKGQEELLGDKLYNSLNPVEKEVFDLLKERKVLRDVELEPKERIALRDLKDFAVPLTIKLGNDSEIFWKFHVITDEEAKPLISEYIEEIPEEVLKQEEKKANDNKKTAEIKAHEEAMLKQKQETKIEINDVVAKLKEELMKEFASKQIQETKKIEEPVKKVEEEEEQEEVVEVKPKKKAIKKVEIAEEENIEEVVEEKEFVDKTEIKKPEGKFYKEILDFFNDSGIKIVKEEMVKKEKEYDFIVRVPSAFGVVSYFVKARDKKAFNDSDVSLAYSAGQLKGLPTILLGKGKLNKKAISLIDEKLSGKFVFKEFE